MKTTNDHGVLIDQMCDRVPCFSRLYATKVRHYVIREHILNVCNQFERYFAKDFCEIDIEFFRKFLVLHDIGKPIAYEKGIRLDQHRVTLQLLSENHDALEITTDQMKWVCLLGGGDTLGEYMQGRKSLIESISTIRSLADEYGFSVTQIFYIQTVYYQCDAGSYTADAGGIRYLEHMFLYHDGAKVYDPNSRILIFSPQFQRRYLSLKNSLLNNKDAGGLNFQFPASD